MDSWFSETRSWSLDLTHRFSQTDTPGERDFGTYLMGRLSETPYFLENPQNLRLERTSSDPQERYVLLALVRGQGPQTLVLTGHYDVVGIENYGALGEWACDPEALLPRLISLLETECAAPPGMSRADRLTLEDLSSGDYLPGRGLLDMKSGLAAGLSVLQHYGQMPLEERSGNLLFVAVPDEEIASNGARTAGALLPELARGWQLDFEAAINLDASNDPGDGSQGQVAYLGSVGKLLPSVYLVGRETHAGSPFTGINANLLAADLTRRIECNASLADSLEGVYAAPPTCLKQADTKARYDVTTPTIAWCYYNWLILRQSVESVLETLCSLAEEALESALASMQASAYQYSRLTDHTVTLPDWHPQVYTFATVKDLALRRGGTAFRDHLAALELELSSDPALDTPTCCLRLTDAVWSASGLTGPAAVVGFSSIFYPPVSLEHGAERSERLRQIIARVAETLSRTYDTSITLQPFFPGISDISFLGGRASQAEIGLLAANTPAWQGRASFDAAAVTDLGIPVVNIGPWGRDYHQRGERVYMPYSFEILPEFLWQIAQELLVPRG